MTEHFYTCPYCFTEVSVLVDTSVREQEYIEDCERCCNPIEFHITCQNDDVVNFEADPIGQ